MASQEPGRREHLDITGDRDVVFCHQCSNEWYRDEGGLQCPSCHCDFCEIITPENDPRDIRPDSSADFPDPDEEFIDPPSYSPFDMNRPPARDRDGSGAQSPSDPNNGSEVFARFQENLSMFMGGPRSPNRNRLGPNFVFTTPAPATQTRMYISPGGRAAFSITTSTGGPARGGMDHGHNHDEFEMLFGNAIGNGSPRPPNAGQPGLDAGLQGLFSFLLGPALAGPNAVHGDVVYTQEALDRIITQLMDNNPQSNAAPPATEAALESLEKKKLDQEMLGDSDKAECTICIDEMKLGDEATVLPCKHWFHGECVVLWLKEHNTCPICRASIEKQDGIGSGNGGSGNGSPPSSGGRRGSRSRRASEGPETSAYARLFSGSSGTGHSGAGGNSWGGDGVDDSPSDGTTSSWHHHHTRGIRSPEERAARLNVIRSLAGPMSYGQPQPMNNNDYSPVRSRRDSRSPSSPPPPGTGSLRERSPSRPRMGRTGSSSWDTSSPPRGSASAAAPSRSTENSRGGGDEGGHSSNILGWIRDRLHTTRRRS